MAHRIANGMAIAMALAYVRDMAHSTPLHYLWFAMPVVQRKSLSESEVTVTYGRAIGFGMGLNR